MFYNVPAPNGEQAYLWCMASGPDRRMWFVQDDFSDSDDYFVDAMTLNGTVQQFPVTNGIPQCITRGPDKNMWATIGGSPSAIAKITTAGKMTFYNLPAGEVPDQIITGPDKNIWFTQFNPEPGFIGRLTPKGQRTEYAVTGYIQQMTVGPDNAIWFTQPNVHDIGRVAIDGSITYFPTGGVPVGIATGSDGNIWFSDESKGKAGAIGRMKLDGKFKEFPVPGGAQYPVAARMAAGPDGKLYCVVGFDVAQIDINGNIKLFQSSIPRLGDGAPAFGPDGNLWISWGNTNVGKWGVIKLTL